MAGRAVAGEELVHLPSGGEATADQGAHLHRCQRQDPDETAHATPPVKAYAVDSSRHRIGTGASQYTPTAADGRGMRVEGWVPDRPRVAQREARAHVDERDGALRLGRFLRAEVEHLAAGGREAPVVLCIGSDRSTGDSLGPLVGSLLLGSGLPRSQVAGDLAEPVHASNLRRVWLGLRDSRPRRAVLAVDACLGRQESVGTMTAGLGPLRPGAGVNKDLPPVGDVYLTGTVNVSGFMEYFVLQNTRLSLVVAMARRMAETVLEALAAPSGSTAPGLCDIASVLPPAP